MTTTEKEHGSVSKMLLNNSWGTLKVQIEKEEVTRMVDSLQKLKCSMSLKIHFMDSRVNHLPGNLGDYSEKKDERFHRDIKGIYITIFKKSIFFSYFESIIY